MYPKFARSLVSSTHTPLGPRRGLEERDKPLQASTWDFEYDAVVLEVLRHKLVPGSIQNARLLSRLDRSVFLLQAFRLRDIAVLDILLHSNMTHYMHIADTEQTNRWHAGFLREEACAATPTQLPGTTVAARARKLRIFRVHRTTITVVDDNCCRTTMRWQCYLSPM